MKKLLIVLGLVLMLATTTIAIADPTDYEKKIDQGIYYLVTKDTNWDPLPRSTNAFGMGRFDITEDGYLDMHLVCHKLDPNNWYFVEIVSHDGGWTPLNDGWDFEYYVYTNIDGTFELNIMEDLEGYGNIEVLVKNCDWVYNDGWIYWGQGWDYLLYGAALI